jgi:tRNA G10  N-methylase Trm11
MPHSTEGRNQQIQLLTNCIVQSIDDLEFRWEQFFKLWFRENGTPFFFLFKRNLGVTNTQFLELFNLITIHSSCILDTAVESKLLFYGTEHIKNTFSEAIISLLESFDGKDNTRFHEFSERYIDVFSVTVAVDMFYGSSAVFTPPGITVNLDQVVADAGYIHSAGHSLYIRNIKKAKHSDFIQNVRAYAEKLPAIDQSEKIPFVVYSHEDFSAFDKDHTELMDRGIEQCKIFVEKMNMGSERLSSIISDLGEIFKEKLLVPKPGDYRHEHNFKKTKSLWLISDRSISSGQLKNPGGNRYYICYEQMLKNDSPFFYFDENKPAWKSHTTMPHSLTAALLNIARPIVAGGHVCDPFGGTGTTWLEVKRLNLQTSVRCSDLSPSATLLLQDNINFFCLDSKQLGDLSEKIGLVDPKNYQANQTQLRFDSLTETIDYYSESRRMIERLKKDQPNEDQEYDLTEELIQELQNWPEFARIIFYITLRADLRFQGSFKRKSLTFEAAFTKSKEKLLEQMKMLMDLKEEVELDLSRSTQKQLGSFYKTKGTYSSKVSPRIIFSAVNSLQEGITGEVFSSMDARQLPVDAYDLIMCDPPYGFNTTEDGGQLAALYSEFLDKAIKSLKAMGQLILCLPAESFTGRNLPHCTRSDLVSRQIIVKAHQQGRKVYSPVRSIPLASLSPPYYWESERALRRTILHFRFL